MERGTVENGSAGGRTPTSLSGEPRAMSTQTPVAKSDTTDVLTRNEQTGLVFDWGTELPVEVPGGDVVFVRVLERTDDGHALTPAGDVPVAVTSIHSPTDVRNALHEAGYATEHIERAMARNLRGEQGRKAARIAESQTHDHPAQLVTDGGSR